MGLAEEPSGQGGVPDFSDPPATSCAGNYYRGPSLGWKVGFRHAVYGTIRPSRSVQVLVFSADRKWYPQGPVEVNGESWRLECQFGKRDSIPGNIYQILAISADARIQSPLTELPQGLAQSQIITVTRVE